MKYKVYASRGSSRSIYTPITHPWIVLQYAFIISRLKDTLKSTFLKSLPYDTLRPPSSQLMGHWHTYNMTFLRVFFQMDYFVRGFDMNFDSWDFFIAVFKKKTLNSIYVVGFQTLIHFERDYINLWILI